MENLEELKKKYEELGQKINELENNLKNKNNRSRVNHHCKYYYINYINGDLEIDSDTECNCKIDDSRYNMGNYFKTKEQAEKALRKILIYTKLKDLANRLSEEDPVDWSNSDQDKFYIYYDHYYNSLSQNSFSYTHYINNIYCTCADFLRVAIKKIGEKELKELFENE